MDAILALIEAAEAHFRNTSIGCQEWLKRTARPDYPTETTSWYKGFADLAEAKTRLKEQPNYGESSYGDAAGTYGNL